MAKQKIKTKPKMKPNHGVILMKPHDLKPKNEQRTYTGCLEETYGKNGQS